ncbi:gamma-aminobutyric acid receptor subunit rho-1-like [Rhopilema esculentum]|uniref:gamma-aminobutyric acid receptor subunit rho-1-like n=1 Tax=Rhopilema esculentum TaxID=499914 RepID=UPI0031DFEA06
MKCCPTYLITVFFLMPALAQSDWLKNVTRNYDKRLRPNAGGSAVNVSVQIGIVSLGPINAKDFTFEIDMYLRHWWNDPRLKSDANFTYNYNGDPADIIWVPDTYFENSKKTVTHHVMTQNKRAIIKPNGDIFVSIRATATSSCPMDLRLYPFDTQKCRLILGSYSFSGNNLDMNWKKDPVTIDTVSGYVQVSSYVFKRFDTRKIKYVMGNPPESFVVLECIFTLKRSFVSSLSRIYIPSSFLVLLTWATFYLPKSAVPARVTLIVTNFLATVFIMQSTASQISDVEYTTAVGVYLLNNVIFITLALFELLLVLNIRCRTKGEGKTKNKQSQDNETELGKLANDKNKDEVSSEQEKEIQKFHLVDRYAKLVFPISYFIFIVAYFSYFIPKTYD